MIYGSGIQGMAYLGAFALAWESKKEHAEWNP